MHFIGIDLGTSGIRSVVADDKLEVKATVYTENPLIKISNTHLEQDADTWWECVKTVTKRSIEDSGICPNNIKSICVSSQGISFVLVDISGKPMRNAITWLDSRAAKQKEDISKALPEQKYFGITGKYVSESSVPAKILWLKEIEPESLRNANKIFTAHDFIVHKLCGAAVTDHTLAAGMQLYDLSRGDWSPEMLDILGITPDILPEIKQSGRTAGIINKSVAEELGLCCDVIIAVGGQDQKCAALGAGIGGNIATVSLGTAAAITMECISPSESNATGIPCHPYLMKNRWVSEGVVGNACNSLNWLRETLFADKTYSELNRMAESVYGKENTVFFYPHLSGTGTPYNNKKMRGLLYGISLPTKKEEIVKSVLEGVAYQIKTNLDILEKEKGEVNEIRIFGGGSKSDIWCRIISAITAKKVVRLSTPETAGIGACILAGIAAGAYESPDDAAKWIKTKDSFSPDGNMASGYERKYCEYLRIERNLDALMRVNT